MAVSWPFEGQYEMTEQPKTVVCTSCSAKFHVPDDLIRGKLVKFRCRKCGSAIEVDGRKSARASSGGRAAPRPRSLPSIPPPRFPSGRLPPATAPSAAGLVSKHAANLHPWPEPPRTRSTRPHGISRERAARSITRPVSNTCAIRPTAGPSRRHRGAARGSRAQRRRSRHARCAARSGFRGRNDRSRERGTALRSTGSRPGDASRRRGPPRAIRIGSTGAPRG